LRNDDGSSALINLGFTFQFYGVNYTSCFINNNGNITFGRPISRTSPPAFPAPRCAMIAPFWADVDTRIVATAGLGTTHRQQRSGGNDTLIVRLGQRRLLQPARRPAQYL